MHRSLLLALPLLLVGCPSGPGSSLGEDLACEFDPHDWNDNAFAALLQADDGVFSYDPIGDAVIERTGSYDFETGDYESTSTYADEHPYVTIASEGYGTIYDNGDLDLIAKSTYEDVLGEIWAQQVRTKREGCTGSYTQTELDVDAPVDAQPDEWADTYEWTTTIVSDTQVDYHAERNEEYGLYVTDRSVTPDYAYQGSFDYADGAYAGTMSMLWDGSGTTTWEQQGATFDSDYDYVGVDEHYLNGSRLTDYDVYAGGSTSIEAEVELLWLYDGSATGTYVIHQSGSEISCEVTITEGGETCTMYCVGYGTQDC
jgi:hypothetical protein